MKVLVTGATGFTGSYVVPLLLEQGIEVRCLVRPASRVDALPLAKTSLVQGDLDDQSSVENALQGADALVNIASLGFGHAPKLVQATQSAGIQRAIFISTTAIFTSLNAPSKTVRLAAEETIQKSELNYTILRPTMIYGDARDRNMSRLIGYLRRFPVIPVFGSGDRLQQPVFVADVAKAVVGALLSPTAVRRCYNIAGLAPVSFNTVIDTICAGLNRRVWKWHLPAELIVRSLKLAECCKLPLPVKAEQVLRLNEDKVFDFAEATRDFGYQPLVFRDGIRAQLRKMELAGLFN